jgi:hypothetical protein
MCCFLDYNVFDIKPGLRTIIHLYNMDNLKQLLGISNKSIDDLLGIASPISRLGSMFGMSTPAVENKQSTWDFFPGEVINNIKKARDFISDKTTPKNEKGQPLSREEALAQGIIKVGNYYLDPTGVVGSIEDVSAKASKNFIKNVSKKVVSESEDMARSVKPKLYNAKQGGTYLTPKEFTDATKRADGLYLDKHGDIVWPKKANPSMGKIETSISKAKASGQSGETITLYRAAPKFPDGNFEKGTYFATSENSARWNAESHYKGEPQDITIRKYTIPKSSVIKEGNNYRLATEYPAKVIKDNNLTSSIKSANPSMGKIDDLSTSISKAKAEGKSFDEWVKGEINAYHGTAADFEKFSDSFKGSITDAQSAKGAFWFTDDPATAKAYSIYAAETGPINKLMRQHAALEKIAQKSGKNSDWLKVDNLTQKIDDLGGYEATYDRRVNAKVKDVSIKGDFLEVDAKGKTPQELGQNGDIDSWLNQQLEKARKLNKIGLKIKNIDDAVGLYNRPSTHYAVFNSDVIKTRSQLKAEWDKIHGKN